MAGFFFFKWMCVRVCGDFFFSKCENKKVITCPVRIEQEGEKDIIRSSERAPLGNCNSNRTAH